jgi:hypothetical protein
VLRRLAALPVALIAGALLLAGCSTPTSDSPTGGLGLEPDSTPSAAPDTVDGGPGKLPDCDAIAAAMSGLVDGLELDVATGLAQEAQESYEQRVCVYRTGGGAAIGVTIAGIPFQQTELDAYAARPNAIADDRLEAHHAVLQTFETGDGADGTLDSSLYLIDTQWSVTIQGVAEGSTIAETFPQLTLPAATDAAFAVRELFA